MTSQLAILKARYENALENGELELAGELAGEIMELEEVLRTR